MQPNRCRLALAVFFVSATAAQSQPLEIVGSPRSVSPTRHGKLALGFELNADSIRQADGDVRIQLPGRGGTVLLHRTRFEDRGDGDGFWVGSADGRDDSEVLLTVKNGYMAGTIRYGSEVYEVRPAADGHVLELLDFNSFPACAGAERAEGLENDPLAVAPEILERAAARAGRPVALAGAQDAAVAFATGDSVFIDLLSAYTPQARAAAGGTAQIGAVIQAAVDASNQAFVNSNIGIRYRLVRAVEVAYNDSGNIKTDMTWVSTSAEVAAQRDLYGADLVSLVVNNGGGYCGVGYVMRSVSPSFASAAFQVTVRSCAVGNLTFAHEHGHNLGMEHDPANAVASNDASFPWSYGHFVDASFRTVRSYANVCPSGCRRVPYYSNPEVSYLGYPTGVANSKDNARTATLVADLVAGFRTAPSASTPAVPTGLIASAASAGQVNLFWNDASSNETGFRIERSTAGASFVEIAVLPANFSAYPDSTTVHSTSYSYRVRSYNGNGNSAYSNTASVTTPLPPAPLPPSLLVATLAGATQANLAWADNSLNETGFKMERSANGAAFVEITVLAAGSTSFADSTLAPSTTYDYRVRASNAGGNSGYSNTSSVTTQAAASAPSAPAGLSATAANATQVNLAWNDTSSNETGFKVERSSEGGAFAQIATAGANATGYADTSVSGGGNYAYRVRANNATGDSGYSNTATVSTPAAPTAPAAPASVGASVVSATQVNLAWLDSSSNETGFKVERSTNGSAFAEVAVLGSNTSGYFDLTTTAGSSYSYRVRAYNAVGHSAYSNTATANTPAAPTAPSAPAGLLASVIGSSQVNLAWSDTSSNETGFKVERSANGGGFVEIASLGANATGHSDTTVSAGNSYAYRVKAYNGLGDSAYSNTANAVNWVFTSLR